RGTGVPYAAGWRDPNRPSNIRDGLYDSRRFGAAGCVRPGVACRAYGPCAHASARVKCVKDVALTRRGTADSGASPFDAIEWALRLGIALVFVGIGCEKVFPWPGSYWI